MSRRRLYIKKDKKGEISMLKLKEKLNEAKTKVWSFMATKHGKASVIFGTTVGTMTALTPAGFCTSGDTTVGDLDFAPIISSITGAITPQQIILVIAATIAAGAGFVIAWFGIRKVKAALSKGIFRGKF